jgi:hypothetical protein
MVRIAFILLLSGLMGSSLLAQDKSSGAAKPTEKIMLRTNTRDGMVMMRADAQQLRMQNRDVSAVEKGKMMQERRMMLKTHREASKSRLHKGTPKRAAERQMMRNRGKNLRQQRSAGARKVMR